MRRIGRLGLAVCSRATVLHAERTQLEGGWLLAANHVSHYDVAPIARSTARLIDWVSITEVFAVPWLRWFCGRMGAFPIDRGRLDPHGLRVIYQRLSAGRVVGIFPEGALATTERTILEGHFRSGIGKLAFAADVPIVPCVHLGTESMGAWYTWLPLKLVRYGVAFGEPLYVDRGLGRRAAALDIEARMVSAMEALALELEQHGLRRRPPDRRP
ncbi:MAG: lysophospholipid acyltransferase family protein [Planctomycetota bacterium]